MMRRNAVFSVLVLLVATQMAWGEVPRTMSNQGVLRDADGDLVADGSYGLTFKLYDALSGGTELWTETQGSVQISKGIFSVVLGNTTPLALPFDQQYYLGITVGAGAELAPRIPLTASPYSLNSPSASQFLIIDGQPAPSIFFKQQSGNADFSIDIATTRRCNLIVFAEGYSRGHGGWTGVELFRNGSSIAKDVIREQDATTRLQGLMLNPETLEPTDGTVTYRLHDVSGSSDFGIILRTRFIVLAVPLE